MKLKKIVGITALLLATLSGVRAGVLNIAAWNFENIIINPNNAYVPNPTPSTQLTTATATALGMAGWPTTSAGTNDPDVLLGVTSDTGADGVADLTQVWRVRAQNAAGTANGWSSAAPIGSQGAQFNVDTTGFSSPINVAFDWYATTKGEGRFQLQYTTDNWTTSNNVAIIVPTSEQASLQISNNPSTSPSYDANTVAGYFASDNSKFNPTTGGQDWFTNLSASISDPAAANNANFGFRVVNASTGSSCISAAGAALNNSSGNWRFDNVSVSGTAPTGPTLNPASGITADSSSFTITFAATPAWSSKITSITVGSYSLPLNSSTTNSTSITFNMADPNAGNLFRTNASVTILVMATGGYAADSVVQTIAPGAPASWAITQQPTGPTGNGGTLVINPIVSILDHYGNPTPTASGNVTAATAGGTWSFGPGSGTTVTIIGGLATFTNLSAVSAAAVPAAEITFTTGSFTPTNTTAFVIPAPLTSGFAPTNLAVFQEDAVAKNSTFSILEVNPVNSTLVHTYPVSATGSNALRTTSAATTGRLSDSGDGTLVCFNGFETQDGSLLSTPDVTIVNPRAAATFDASGNFTLQAAYSGGGSDPINGTNNQTRSATSIDNRTWWIGDKGGVYTNTATSPVITVAGNNVRSMKTFGGIVYFEQQASGKVVAAPISLITPGTLVPVALAGFNNESNDLDFYMVQSGQNGNSYDTLYYIDGTTATSPTGPGGIFKYYYTGTDFPGTSSPLWVQASGSPAVANNYSGDGLCARTNATGGIDLFFTTGSGGIAGNSLMMVHDSGGTNTLTLGTPTTIYTASANSTLKGVAFAPIPPVFNLGNTNLVVGPAAGSNSVVLGITPVTALNAWTASTNATWLHLSTNNQAGFGGTNVTFTYDANSGATRSSSLTIAGQTLNITQAGTTYVAADPLTLVVSAAPVSVAVDKAGNVYAGNYASGNGAVAEWSVTNNVVTVLVNSSQVSGIDPAGVAVDAAGNVYIADSGNDAIEEWSASSHTVTTLVNATLDPGLVPEGVAVDAAGNVYIADNGNVAVEEWSPANPSMVNTLVNSGSGFDTVSDVAVDAAGNNVYIADPIGGTVYEWSVPNTTLTPLVNASQVSGIQPNAVAVDGAGNVYIADAGNGAFDEWTAVNQAVTPLASGITPGGVAVDGAGNVYIGTQGSPGAIKELPRAFVDATAKSETGSVGSDALPVVLPATENLGAPFVPTSNQSWLTIISTNNGVVTFGFTANAGPGSRSANIGLLGQTIAVSQAVGSTVITPLNITPGSVSVTGSGGSAVASFSFTNATGLSFSVHATNNLTAPRPWPVVSTVMDSGAGHYHFTDPNPATNAALFYYLSQP